MRRLAAIRRRRALAAAALVTALVVPASAASDDRTRPRVSPVAIAAVPAAGTPAGRIPADYLAAYRSAGARFGVGWRLLAAVGATESGHGASTLPGVHAGATPAGAAGPAQLCVSERCGSVWQTWAADGDGDGRVSVHDPDDAFHTAARYLSWLRAQVGPEPGRLLAAYNAGPGAVLAHGGVPPYPETRRYVDVGTRLVGAL